MGTYQTKHGVVVPEHAIRAAFSRASGPGGQHVNTSSTRVQVRILFDECQFDPSFDVRARARWGSELRVEDSSTRSQWRNRSIALRRALELLDELAVPRRSRVATKATRSSQRRRLDEKTRRGRLKQERRRGEED